jgi:hypothetical protein
MWFAVAMLVSSMNSGGTDAIASGDPKFASAT